MSAGKQPAPDELLVAIRAYCMDCSGGCRKEVEKCRITRCPLHPYRSVSALGKEKASTDDGDQITIFDIVEASVS